MQFGCSSCFPLKKIYTVEYIPHVGKSKIANISWNASLLSLEKARETVVPILEELAGDDQQIKSDMLGMFAMMYRHKKLHYAQDRRFIVDFSLTDIDEGIYLEVASTPLPA